jgi:hypothetical protein
MIARREDAAAGRPPDYFGFGADWKSLAESCFVVPSFMRTCPPSVGACFS